MANRQLDPVGYRPFRASPLLADGLLAVERDGGETLRKTSVALQRFADEMGRKADVEARTAGIRDVRREAAAGSRLARRSVEGSPTVDGAAVSVEPKQGNQQAVYARDYLVKKHGMSSVAAAAMAGHGMQESGFNLDAIGDQGTAYGVYQWRGDRLSNLKSYAASKGGDWKNLDTQLDFAVHELGTSEARAGKALSEATSLDDAVAAFMHFERPQGYTPNNPRGGHGFANRLAFANGLSAGASEPANVVDALPETNVGSFRPTGRNTVYGRAYDEEGARLYLQTLDLEIRNTTAQVYEKYKDDPRKMAEVMGALKAVQLKEDVFEEIAPEFDLAFEEHSQRYIQQGVRNAEVRAKQERLGALDNRTNELKTEIGRSVEALDPEDDGTAMALESSELALSEHYDTAVREGLLTRPEAEAEKRASRRATARRFYGRQAEVHDADGVKAMRERMREDYASGKLEGLDDAGWLALSADLEGLENKKRGDETKNAGMLTAEERIEANRLEGLIGDDVASTAATGAGLDPSGGGLDPQRVLDLLGEKRFETWQRERSFAARSFQASAGMETETPEEISQRLTALEPQPGKPGYEEAQRIYGDATRNAAQIVKDREIDPALFVLRHQPGMLDRWQKAQEEGGDIRSAGREILAAQAELGVPEDQRKVLSAGDAALISKRFLVQKDGGEGPAQLMRAEKERWGDLWPKVFGELSGELPGAVMVVGAMDMPGQERGAEELAEAVAAGGEATFKKLLPSASLTDAKDRASANLAPFSETLAGLPGSEATTTAVADAVNLLAMRYMATGDSPSRAADRAFEDIIGRKYKFQNGYRVPRTVDDGKVGDGTRLLMADFAEGEFEIDLPTSGLDEKETKSAFVSAIINDGQWVTSPMEDGLTLYAPDGAAVTIDGKPLSFTWQELTGYRRKHADEFIKLDRPAPAIGMAYPYRTVLDQYLRGEITADVMRQLSPPQSGEGR